MSAGDVSDTLDDALKFTSLNSVKLKHKPSLLSDNGPGYLSADLATYLDKHDMRPTRGRPYHPQTQGKIARWHQPMKNRVLLENYYSPGDQKLRVGEFVECCNHERYHESLRNLTPADSYYGRGQTVLDRRKKIKLETLAMRKQMHYDRRASQLI